MLHCSLTASAAPTARYVFRGLSKENMLGAIYFLRVKIGAALDIHIYLL